jgi:septum formation protein
MRIILASASKERQRILSDLGYNFDIVAPEIDEKKIRFDDFRHLPLLVARAKSDNLVKHIKNPAIIITADTVVIHNGVLREKPAHAAEAREYLSSYGTAPVEVVCGLVVHNTKTGKRKEGIDSAKVYFHKFTESLIEELLALGSVYNWAGGFNIDVPQIKKHVAHIEGDESIIRGMPAFLVRTLINEIGNEQ